MNDKVKHLELIQGVVNRLAGNSFLIKGWSVTLTSALFALAAARSDRRFVLLSYFPVMMFWILDSYFLYQERLFRKLYDQVRAASTSDFSMDTTKLKQDAKTWAQTAFSITLLIFYGTIVGVILIIMFAVLRS
jgi:hypothetical protein